MFGVDFAVDEMKGMVFGREVGRRAMHLGKASLAVVGIVLVYVTVLTGTGGTEKTERVPSGSVDSPVPVYPEIVDKVVEQIWSNCGLDLKDIKEVVKILDFSVLGVVSDSTDINIKKQLFARSTKWEFIALLSPELKHMLLDCLTKQNFHFCATGDDRTTRNRYTEYMESLYGCNPFSRRHLAGQPVQVKRPVSVKAPAPAPALLPTTAVTVEPSSEPASSPAEIIPDPSPTDFLPPKFPDHPAEPGMPSHDKSPVRSSKNQSKSNQDDSKRSVVIAVVVAGIEISLLVACLCCYYGCLRDKQGLENVPRDDRPLLSLSMSDYSGSSHKSFGGTSLVNKDKLGVLSFKSDRSQSGCVLSLNKSNEAPPTAAFQGIAAPSVELSSIPYNNPVTKPTSVSATEQSGAPNNTPAPKTPPLPPLTPPPIKKVASSPPAPPPPLPNLKPGSRPPPLPKGTLPPPAPQANRPSPLGSRQSANASVEQLGADDSNAPRSKLKPFFWDKVSTNSDQSMVWDQIKSGSFQFNEEMIETLFGYSSADKNKNDSKKKELSNDSSPQYIQLIDKRKSQNLAILLRALNVKIEEVCDALSEGNKLPAELLQNLLRMAPTTDEELKLRLYNGDPLQLGPAEQFMKAMVVIPFAFKRMDALLFMSTLEEEASSIKESFAILQVACQELRSSRLFLKLLEAVLKTGNRMNDGTFRGSAQAFKLDTLLKLSDVKGIDGKTTLLHFVVREIIRSEGLRAVRMPRESGSISSLTVSSLNSDDFVEESPSETEDHYRNLGLKVVSGLGNELENVKKAAGLDADALTNSVAHLGHRLVRMKEFLNTDMKNLEEESGFHLSLKSFVDHAEADITSLLGEEKRIRSLVKSTTDYFHGNAGKDEGLHLFVIVRNFLGILDKVCKEVRDSSKKAQKVPKTRDTRKMAPAPDPKQMLFPAIRDRRMDSSSSDDEGP